MKRKFAILTILLSIIPLGRVPLLGQTVSPPNSWENVKAIPRGERVEVKLKTGKDSRGTVDSISDSDILILSNGKVTTIARSEVRRLYRVVKKGNKNAVLLGAVVGGGIGAGGTAASAATNDGQGLSTGAALLPVVGALTGALIGFAFRRKATRTLVFEQN